MAFLLAAQNCNRDPAVVKLADTNLPKAVYSHLAGSHVAVVAVTLDSSGKVTDASIYQSTGNTLLDDAAVDAAKRSTYTPGETNCAPSGGTFAVQLTFDGDLPANGNSDCPRAARAVSVVAPNGAVMRGTGISYATVAIEVTIGPDGKLTEAHIAKSAGNMALDQAALAAALHSTYEPRYDAVPVRRQARPGQSSATEGVRCVPVTGSYYFRVTFRTP